MKKKKKENAAIRYSNICREIEFVKLRILTTPEVLLFYLEVKLIGIKAMIVTNWIVYNSLYIYIYIYIYIYSILRSTFYASKFSLFSAIKFICFFIFVLWKMLINVTLVFIFLKSILLKDKCMKTPFCECCRMKSFFFSCNEYNQLIYSN